MPILEWLNKNEAVKVVDKAPYRLLKANSKLSYGEQTGNMLIKGDNLEALKALLPYYKGQVKCIYIDPPYNTGNAFEHYDDNLEHSMWLSLIYPRIELLRELLSEDGSIWISIDDDESHYLKVICDEVFGRKNFIANCLWQKIHSIKNDAKHLSINHDHILVYAKNEPEIVFNLLQRTSKMDARYKNPDKDPRGPWQSGDLVANEERKNGYFDVVGPTGRIFNVPVGKHWVYTQENLEEMIKDNRIWFGKDGSSFPRKKRFLSEVQQGRKGDTWWSSEEVGHVLGFNMADVLPSYSPFFINIESFRDLGSPDFEYVCKFNWGIKEVFPQRYGCFLKHRHKFYYLDSYLFKLLSKIDEFNKLDKAQKNKKNNLQYFAEIKKTMQQINTMVKSDTYINNENVIIPDKVKLNIVEHGDSISVMPLIEGTNTDSFKSQFELLSDEKRV